MEGGFKRIGKAIRAGSGCPSYPRRERRGTGDFGRVLYDWDGVGVELVNGMW